MQRVKEIRDEAFSPLHSLTLLFCSQDEVPFVPKLPSQSFLCVVVFKRDTQILWHNAHVLNIEIGPLGQNIDKLRIYRTSKISEKSTVWVANNKYSAPRLLTF